MNIGILGTGAVGQAIATTLVGNKHKVMMGSRTSGGDKAKAWVKKAGKGAHEGTFDETVAFADLVFICLNGEHTLHALRHITPANINGKIVVDLTNPLDFTQGIPPRILEEYRNVSLGEKVQEALPDAYVVKTLNTINYNLMVDARKVGSAGHNLFLSGNNEDAKNKVKHFLVDNFHWRPDGFIDLGGIVTARTVEAIVPFWVLVWQSLGTPLFNFKVVH